MGVSRLMPRLRLRNQRARAAGTASLRHARALSALWLRFLIRCAYRLDALEQGQERAGIPPSCLNVPAAPSGGTL